MLQQSLLFQFKHGDHTCVFYRTQDSLREVLTPYIADGIRKGERCFLVQKPDVSRQLLYDLRFLGIDTDAAARRGALEIHTEEEAYRFEKGFDPATMIDLLLLSIDKAQSDGFTGLRTAGELGWAVEGRDECDQLMSYEKLVDQNFSNLPVTGLCQYHLDAFAPDVLQAVMDHHQLHLTERGGNSFHTGITVRDKNCWTEIVADKLVINPHYYYVVQRRRSSEVLGWGIEPSFDQANEKAADIIRSVPS